ncbi:MAG: metallophosphoesterase family protein [Nitrososphaera sp.]
MWEKLEREAARAGPDGFSQVVEQATAAMLAERSAGMMEGGLVKGGLVELACVNKLAVVSDLHGDSQTLFRILDALGDFLQDKGNKLVFLGDYVDRGSDSACVLYSVCHLKSKHPDSVVLMRGNHEAPAEFPFSPHDLPYEMEDRFGAFAKPLYKQVLSLFRLMTLATTVNGKLLLVHGGLPTEESDPQAIAGAQENHVRSRALEELLWNDPQPAGGWAPSHRGIGRYFGPDVTERWLRATNTQVVVRGHEPCDGFRVDHHGRVLTLFSSKEAYQSFGAAYLVAGGKELAKVQDASDLARYAIRL